MDRGGTVNISVMGWWGWKSQAGDLEEDLHVDVMKESVKSVGVRDKDAVNRVKWGRTIRCGNT